jgi:hypothetical protein
MRRWTLIAAPFAIGPMALPAMAPRAQTGPPSRVIELARADEVLE